MILDQMLSVKVKDINFVPMLCKLKVADKLVEVVQASVTTVLRFMGPVFTDVASGNFESPLLNGVGKEALDYASCVKALRSFTSLYTAAGMHSEDFKTAECQLAVGQSADILIKLVKHKTLTADEAVPVDSDVAAEMLQLWSDWKPATLMCKEFPEHIDNFKGSLVTCFNSLRVQTRLFKTVAQEVQPMLDQFKLAVGSEFL